MKALLNISFLVFMLMVLTFACQKKEKTEEKLLGQWKLRNEDARLEFRNDGSYTRRDAGTDEKKGRWSVSVKGDTLFTDEGHGKVAIRIIEATDKDLILYEPMTADSMVFEAVK